MGKRDLGRLEETILVPVEAAKNIKNVVFTRRKDNNMYI